MKKVIAFLSIVLCLCMLSACAGTPVIYQETCDCPPQGSTPELPVPEGALKTGLAIVSDISGSNAGEGKYDITMVAVLVDDDGVIQDCVIDGISTSVTFDTSGKITSDLTATPKTKNELGADYGMVAWGKAIAEWNEQAASFAKYVKGKTVDEVKGIATDSSTKPTEPDLTSSVTIAIGGFQAIIEKAVANAKHLGAMGGDTLKLASTASISGSTDASADKNGTTQLEVTTTALTMKDSVITSCFIDSVQAKVNFDASGAVKSDLGAEIKTKNELGADYGMVAWGNAIAEWNEQAASFAKYVRGKTVAEVKGIAVDSSTKPTESDLASSVTIAIGGFQALIEKAAK